MVWMNDKNGMNKWYCFWLIMIRRFSIKTVGIIDSLPCVIRNNLQIFLLLRPVVILFLLSYLDLVIPVSFNYQKPKYAQESKTLRVKDSCSGCEMTCKYKCKCKWLVIVKSALFVLTEYNTKLVKPNHVSRTNADCSNNTGWLFISDSSGNFSFLKMKGKCKHFEDRTLTL